MLSLPPSVRIFIARGATDICKSFDTLATVACDVTAEPEPDEPLLALLAAASVQGRAALGG